MPAGKLWAVSVESASVIFNRITLSSGAVIAGKGDSMADLSKTADTALYVAKETHDGSFAYKILLDLK